MNGGLVLFVCTGNQCRSPMAEYMLRRELGPDSPWTVTSAGVGTIDGFPASGAAIAAMKEAGVDIAPHRSRRVTEDMVEAADFVIGLTRSHCDEIAAGYPRYKDKVFLLKGFGGSSKQADVLDPAGLSTADYRKTRDEIAAEIPGIAERLRKPRAR